MSWYNDQHLISILIRFALCIKMQSTEEKDATKEDGVRLHMVK